MTRPFEIGRPILSEEPNASFEATGHKIAPGLDGGDLLPVVEHLRAEATKGDILGLSIEAAERQELVAERHSPTRSVILPVCQRLSYRVLRSPLSVKIPTMLQSVLMRVEERLEAVGLSASAASKKAGLSEDAIRNLRRAVEKGDTRQGISTRTVQALAPVLETTAAYLLNGPIAETFGTVTTVPLAGRIVAGGVIDVSTEQSEPGVEYEVELSAQIADAVVAYQVGLGIPQHAGSAILPAAPTDV